MAGRIGFVGARAASSHERGCPGVCGELLYEYEGNESFPPSPSPVFRYDSTRNGASASYNFDAALLLDMMIDVVKLPSLPVDFGVRVEGTYFTNVRRPLIQCLTPRPWRKLFCFEATGHK